MMTTADTAMIALASALLSLFGVFMAAEISTILQSRRERRRLAALPPPPLQSVTVGEPSPRRRSNGKRPAKAESIIKPDAPAA